MIRVFIIGAGYVAGKLAQVLQANAHGVSLGKRQPDSGLPEGLAAGTPVYGMDVSLPASFPPALFEADVIVYCVSSDGFSPEQYRSAYPSGLSNVLTALEKCQAQHQPRRLIFVSSTSVFSQDDGSRVDESSPAEPRAFSGQIMLEAEQVLQTFVHEHPGFEGCSIRFSGIYGPGRTRMVEDIRAGKPVSAARWAQWTNRIHRDDCAAALMHLVERPKIASTYVASDMQPARFGEIAEWVSRTSGTPLPAILDTTAQAGEAKAPPRSGGLERGGHKQCWSTTLLAEGFQFTYPGFREGYAALLANGTKPGTGDHR